jgi:hypothetical protein
LSLLVGGGSGGSGGRLCNQALLFCSCCGRCFGENALLFGRCVASAFFLSGLVRRLFLGECCGLVVSRTLCLFSSQRALGRGHGLEGGCAACLIERVLVRAIFDWGVRSSVWRRL